MALHPSGNSVIYSRLKINVIALCHLSYAHSAGAVPNRWVCNAVDLAPLEPWMLVLDAFYLTELILGIHLKTLIRRSVRAVPLHNAVKCAVGSDSPPAAGEGLFVSEVV